jgi:hypothetical protein
MNEEFELEDLDANGEEFFSENNATESTEEVEKTYTKKEVEEMMAALKTAGQTVPSNQSGVDQTDVMKAMLETLTKMNRKSDEEIYGYDGEKYVDKVDIDVDDMLENPITFFCHRYGYVIVDDSKNGRRIRIPYNKKMIAFVNNYSRLIGHGREQDIEHISTYTCYSKKEADFLREHKMFNSMFFESYSAAKNVGNKEAMKMAKYINRIKDMDIYQVRKSCRENNIPTLESHDEARVMLASFYAKQELEAEKVNSDIRVSNAVKEKFVVEK